MTIADERLIDAVIGVDEELRLTVEEHRFLDEKVDRLNRRKYLTPSEEQERKKLQKKRLMGKDRIQEILRQYRSHLRVLS